jgi:hypothetical protein
MRTALAALFSAAVLAAPSNKFGVSSAAHSPAHANTFCEDLAAARGASWTYSWALSPANTSCAALARIPFEPMVWGSDAARNVTPAAVPQSTHLLAF